MSTDRVLSVCALLLSFVPWQVSLSQSIPTHLSAPASDPQAVRLANTAMAALTRGVAIQDVTLTGSVVSGTDSGTAILMAMPGGESRMDLSFPDGIRTEVRDAQNGIRLGQWVNPDGTSGYFASQNCWTDASWFFPALGFLAGGPSVVLSYSGEEIRTGRSVQHIAAYLYRSGQVRPSNPQPFSAMDFYLDSATFLPTAISYTIHPDNDPSTNLPVEIDFTDYHTFAGIAVPTHIQRYQQGSLTFDVTVTGASFNSGLALSQFAIN